MTKQEDFDIGALFKEEKIKIDPKTLSKDEKKEILTLAGFIEKDEKKEKLMITKSDVGIVSTPFTPPNPRNPQIKEVPPPMPEASVSDHNLIGNAMNGRLESDIPLDDDYWRIKNEIMIRSRVV